MTTSTKYRIMNNMSQNKAGRRRTWKTRIGAAKTEFEYFPTTRPYIVTCVAVMNQVNKEITKNGYLKHQIERTVVTKIKTLISTTSLYHSHMEMKQSKRKVMMENDIAIHVHTTQIDTFESSVYLGQRFSSREKTRSRYTKKHHGWLNSNGQAPRHFKD